MNRELIQNNFGAALRLQRETLGWTREQLAERSGFSPQNIAKIETGERFITADSLSVFCNIFQVSPAYFFESDTSAQDSDFMPVRKKLNLLLDKLNRSQISLVYDLILRIWQEIQKK